MKALPKYRIIYVNHKGDPCHWQAQERVRLFFWRDLGGNVSSIRTARDTINTSLYIDSIIDEAWKDDEI